MNFLDVTIHLGDCLDFIQKLASEKVDAVVTDPPYGIGMSKKKHHRSIRDNKRWPDVNWDEKRIPEVVSKIVGLAPVCAIWGGNYYTDILSISSAWLAWIKPEAESGFSLADMELCWTNTGKAARVKHIKRRDGNLHPTQKPVSLMKWCLEIISKPGDTIFDPFMGSGSTAIACIATGRKFIGCEIDPTYFTVAQKRIEEAQGVGSLFDPKTLALFDDEV